MRPSVIMLAGLRRDNAEQDVSCDVTTKIVNPAGGCVISARVGETIEIDLPENPTTGFLWYIEGADGSALVTSDFELGGEAVGAGGTRTFRITPQRQNDEHIVLSLRRASSTHPVEERDLTLAVAP
jgi:inhibitor of cysteine peptidase